ncbi:MAG TPA: hypothetical protein VK814_07425 [Acidobacteriaceae bacterium]|nr:hypothetical protein [Acidobacteriaceae bacterium]
MLQFAADRFVQIGNILRELEGLCSISRDLEKCVASESVEQVGSYLKVLNVVCAGHGMVSSSKKCQRILEIVKNDTPTSFGEWHVILKDLRERIEDDLESQYFLHLEPKEANLYNQPLEGWEDVFPRFPKVRHNIQESSRCFALERYGAAVFHILLVAEYGVIQVATLLEVNADKPGWSQVERLQKILKKPYAERSELEKKHSKLLEDVVPLAMVVKDSWRHKLTHVDNQIVWEDTDFSPMVAEEIISATRGFMRKLALALKKGKR